MNEEKRIEEAQRNARTANAVSNAANIASNTNIPQVKAIGTGIKVADKLTDGEASKKIGEALNNAAKKNPQLNKMKNVAERQLNNGTSDRLTNAMNKNKRPFGSRLFGTGENNNSPVNGTNANGDIRNNGSDLNNPTMKDTEEQASDGGGKNFNVAYKVVKWTAILMVPIMTVLIVICLFTTASNVYIKAVGLKNADSVSEKDANEKINKKTQENPEDLELEEEDLEASTLDTVYEISKYLIADSNTSDISTFAKSKLNNSIVKVDSTTTTYLNRKYGWDTLSEIENFYPAVDDESKNYDKNMVYDFYYKMYNLYKEYEKIGVKLDMPLLMATLQLQSDDMYVVFESNLLADDRNPWPRKSYPEFDYYEDWMDKGYISTTTSSKYDMAILAQHMVSETDSSKCASPKYGVCYKIDDKKYRKFLREFLEKKYYLTDQPLVGIDPHNLSENNSSSEDYEVSSDNLSFVNGMINTIYDLRQQYLDLVGDYESEVEIKTVSSNKFWWPIGSAETTEKNGKLFAAGNPVSTVITATFGSTSIAAHANGHGAIDISGPYGLGEVNVIAAKSGTVVYPVDKSQTQFETGYEGCLDGGTYGNHVIIEHSDGTYTLYAHLYKNTIAVFAGEVVEQGQVIGKMGSSGSSTGLHLHFEMRKGANTLDNRVNPEEYVNINDPRPAASFSSGGSTGAFSVTETVFTKEEFVAKLRDYCERSGNQAFCSNWSSNAEEVYDASLKYGINPELVVATAGREQGWYNPGGSCNNNYYGIGVPNTGGCMSFSSQAAGIKAYADLLAEYRDSTSGSYSMIVSRNNDREAAGCDPAGHGMPDTYAGVMSIYGWIGTYRYNPGGSSLGGCYYLNHWLYSDDYCSTVPTCTNYDNCPEESKTTVCEQNDYTVFNVAKTVEIRYDIFGV